MLNLFFARCAACVINYPQARAAGDVDAAAALRQGVPEHRPLHAVAAPHDRRRQQRQWTSSSPPSPSSFAAPAAPSLALVESAAVADAPAAQLHRQLCEHYAGAGERRVTESGLPERRFAHTGGGRRQQ